MAGSAEPSIPHQHRQQIARNMICLEMQYQELVHMPAASWSGLVYKHRRAFHHSGTCHC